MGSTRSLRRIIRILLDGFAYGVLQGIRMRGVSDAGKQDEMLTVSP